MRELDCVDASPCGLAPNQGIYPAARTLTARQLWFCGSGSLRGRRWSFLVFEIDLGSLPGPLVCLEVCVIPGKAAHARHQVVREKREISIVVLQRLVVTAPLHRDSILGARQLVLQPQKVFVGFQLRIIFNHNQQAPESRIEPLVGGNLVGRSIRTEQSGARLGNIAKNGYFLRREAFHRLHKVRNQVRAPLQDHVHLRPRRVYRLPFYRHLVPATYKRAAQQQANHQQNRQDRESYFHDCLPPLTITHLSCRSAAIGVSADDGPTPRSLSPVRPDSHHTQAAPHRCPNSWPLAGVAPLPTPARSRRSMRQSWRKLRPKRLAAAPEMQSMCA